MNPPFERSYWVIPGKLAAGCYPGDTDLTESRKKLQGLIQAGIRHVINLMEEDETDWRGNLFVPYLDQLQSAAQSMGTTVSWTRLPIADTKIPSHKEMRIILDVIDASISKGAPVFIHCWGGKGRTGTVVGCYLARHGHAAGEDVINKIKSLRRKLPDAHHPSPENGIQSQMVMSWKEGECPMDRLKECQGISRP